ncbi:MAG: hypothetical protein MK213_07765, partial [Planctomycetes bacterium]|nr:hypothetical protein [Planctomycetota bacterium]
EALAGIVPSHMAVNALDMFFRTDDPEAWCNIGQNAPSITTNSGSFALELGGNPVMSAHHEVANGLVIGIDGTGSSSLTLDFHAYNWGEESHNDDGVWLSSNGLDWESVLASWGSVAQSGNWEAVTGIDLTTTSVDTTQPFYLLFAQADNYEYGTADGIGIDDIVVKEWAPPGPTLSVTPAQPVAGQPAQLVVEFNQPSDMVVIAYSFIGGGPTNTPYGTLYLTPPFGQLPSLFANANGVAGLLANVPPTVSGFNLWLHSLNFTQSVWTNPIATSIL